MAAPLLTSLRPHHWIKNVVVFAAALFALQFDGATWARVSVTFAAFSLASSGFYLINDLIDREEDRQHPVKRHRPIAAGVLSARTAGAAAAALLAGSLLAGFLAAPLAGVCVVVYLGLQAGYNTALKHAPILDVMTLAAGLVLRALGGAAAADVPASGWFVLCIGFLALFLGVEKRKSELRALGNDGATRSVLKAYSLPGLAQMGTAATTGALLTYALWTVEGARSAWLLTTVPLVAYALFKYQQLAEQGLGEEPEKTLTRPPLLATVALWAALCLALLALLA